ncbi:MAG: M15 family metallopeptidase [Bacillota bacterium]
MKYGKVLLLICIMAVAAVTVSIFMFYENQEHEGIANEDAGEQKEMTEIQKETVITEETETNDYHSETVEEEPSTGMKVDEEIESFTYEPLPEGVIWRIKGISWKDGSPVTLEELSYVKVTYWGFDDLPHRGELIVHQKVAEEICEIFQALYEARFPIEKIRLIDEYGADDDLSMADNNTSAFCYRDVANRKGTLSKHSYGVAIDINPIQNPYVRQNEVSPEKGKEYTDRGKIRKGMIIKGDPCYEAFTKRGWTWGGDWKTMKDYQHFQKGSILRE